MMFSRTASTLRQGIQRSAPMARTQTVRKMGGGVHFMKVSEKHTMWGEAFATAAWLWIFHRARLDGPVVLGWRHPWDHAEDPFAPHAHHDDHAEPGPLMEDKWDSFTSKAMIQKEVDDDEDDDDDDDDE